MTTTVKEVNHHWKTFPHQKWPQDIKKFYLDSPRAGLFDKTTPIASMGSCFAGYISRYLRERAFNYVQTESEKFDLFSAQWGIVVSPPCVNQIMRYSFEPEKFKPLSNYFATDTGQWVDPYRSGFIYPGKVYADAIDAHRKNSKKALLSAKVFILTLGLVEVWRDKRDLATYARVPWTITENDEFHVLTVAECVDALNWAILMLKYYNPFVKIILTVSPIPLKASFRKDVDVVVANSYSKSVLRVASNEIVRTNMNTWYFPSYEIATALQTLLPDNRHPDSDTVNTIMEIFLHMYGSP